MGNKKNEYKCILNNEFFYGSLIATILFAYVTIVLTIMIAVEEIQSMIYGFLILSILLSLISFCFTIKASLKKFVINNESFGIYLNDKIILECNNSEIRKIIVYRWVRDVKYIVIDCDQYPFLSSGDIFSNRLIVIRYSNKKLKNIQNYCPNCQVVYDQRY